MPRYGSSLSEYTIAYYSTPLNVGLTDDVGNFYDTKKEKKWLKSFLLYIALRKRHRLGGASFSDVLTAWAPQSFLTQTKTATLSTVDRILRDYFVQFTADHNNVTPWKPIFKQTNKQKQKQPHSKR